MEAVSKTLEGNISNLGDSFDELKLSIGNALLSPAKAVVQAINSIISAITSFAKTNPVMWESLIKTSAVIATVVAAITGYNGIVAALKMFGSVLTAQATGAALKWAAILGPFALGATALVFTITYLEEFKKAKQEQANKTRTNRVIAIASAEITAAATSLSKLDKTIKNTEQGYAKLGSTVNSLGKMIISSNNGMAASIQSIENAAMAASGLGLKGLSDELLQNKNNATLAKEAIDLYLKRIEEYKDNYSKDPKKTTP
jgi:hypothetical protein